MWRGYFALRYHSYLLPYVLEVKDAVAFAYSACSERQVAHETEVSLGREDSLRLKRKEKNWDSPRQMYSR